MTFPASHISEAQKLSADGYVELYEIWLKPSGTLYLKDGPTRAWQGNAYESVPISMTGYSRSTDGQVSRPQLSIGQVDGAFSALIAQGALNLATVIKKVVLRTNFDNNQNVYRPLTWMVGRVMGLNRNQVTLELRTQLDRPNFVVPGKMYLPPDFPTTSLQ